MGYPANKLIPVVVVVEDVPSLDTKGHNAVEKTINGSKNLGAQEK
jgi:hypothetical protein